MSPEQTIDLLCSTKISLLSLIEEGEVWITQVKLDLKAVMLFSQDFVLHAIIIVVWAVIQTVKVVAQQNAIMNVAEVVEITVDHPV